MWFENNNNVMNDINNLVILNKNYVNLYEKWIDELDTEIWRNTFLNRKDKSNLINYTTDNSQLLLSNYKNFLSEVLSWEYDQDSFLKWLLLTICWPLLWWDSVLHLPNILNKLSENMEAFQIKDQKDLIDLLHKSLNTYNNFNIKDPERILILINQTISKNIQNKKEDISEVLQQSNAFDNEIQWDDFYRDYIEKNDYPKSIFDAWKFFFWNIEYQSQRHSVPQEKLENLKKLKTHKSKLLQRYHTDINSTDTTDFNNEELKKITQYINIAYSIIKKH